MKYVYNIVSSQLQQLFLMRELQEAQQQAINRLQAQQQHKVKELRMHIEMQRDVVPVMITTSRFEELKKKGLKWYSRLFYSSMGGIQGVPTSHC